MPSEDLPFTLSSILFRPHHKPAACVHAAGLWWRRRVPPPGPMSLLRPSFIAIAVAGTMNIWRSHP